MGFSHTLYVSKATSSGETPGLVVTIDFPPANFLLGLAHWYLPWFRGSRRTERFSVGCRQKTPLPKSSPRPSGDRDGRDASYSMCESSAGTRVPRQPWPLAQPLHRARWPRKATPPWASRLSGVSQAPSRTFQPCPGVFPTHPVPPLTAMVAKLKLRAGFGPVLPPVQKMTRAVLAEERHPA